jgi:hypothetical protein
MEWYWRGCAESKKVAASFLKFKFEIWIRKLKG